MTKKIEQTNIFTLFGIEDEYSIQKQKEEEMRMKHLADQKKKLEESKKELSSSKSKDDFNVNENTVIYFYTETLNINDYFSKEELEYGIPKKNAGKIEYGKITKNHVRNRLKKELPVLDTGAEMVYIEKKNVVSIILTAKKKGNVKEESERDSSLLKHKIPFKLLNEFITISKYFSNKYGTEVHADIYFDKTDQKFFMDIPPQYASEMWVKLKEENLQEAALKAVEGNFIKCMEIHSHHIMPPIPSKQDDISETHPLLYAIVGNVNEFFPCITVRGYNICSRKHFSLNPSEIFEDVFSTLPSNYDLSVVEVI